MFLTIIVYRICKNKNGSEELKYLSSDKSLKPQKSWEEIFTELSSNPTNDFFLKEEKILHRKNEIGNYLND
ncbi:hypothetical protein MCE_01145 [Rickettsia amblyommatis str. GAT-30V]|uniref:Uncharacterized protein n=1 Tax=Rickettsia amblyommatis (strain GAT-30V) TaxID=1105111 RepID=H8K400_RICAG|nr:hypothetical protein MCE_01145 [Rickettsia amblyommatis str. GAT-30V]